MTSTATTTALSDTLAPCPRFDSASSFASSSPPPSSRRVSFCPLALLIGVAGDGEVEQAMVQAQHQQLGRRKVAVRTLRCAPLFRFHKPPPLAHLPRPRSIEAPNIGEVAGKAWNSLLNGFTASLDPFLHHGGRHGGVCSRSPGRELSPERERDASLSRARSRSRSRSPSPGGRGRSLSPALERMEEEDPSFIPNSPTRLTLKLPTIKRECSLPPASLCCKPILRRPSITSPPTSFSSSFAQQLSASPPFFPSLELAPSASASSSASTPHLYPTLSRTSSQPTCSPAHPEAGLVVPLAPCCSQCEKATVYGATARDGGETGHGAGGGEVYQEKWSEAARRQREKELKERQEREGWEKEAEGLAKRYDGGKASTSGGRVEDNEEEKEAEKAEEEARGSRLAQLTSEGGVDELSMEERHRTDSSSSTWSSSTLGGEAETPPGMDGVEVLGVVETQPVEQGEITSVVATLITAEPEEVKPASPSSTSTSSTRPPSFSAGPPASSSIASTDNPSPAPAPASPRPPKRRLSSSASATTPSSTLAAPSSPSSASLSHRLGALGNSFLQGASQGMGMRAAF
ncbi:hypothetical protein JCM8547_008493 [Rhodosporidiobolus lusitaniae]